jgi:hypothetical protein
MICWRSGSAWLVVLVVSATLLTLGAGFCLFDAAHGDDDDHGMSLDLCLGMLTISVALPLFASLPETGRAVGALLPGVMVVALTVPAPPPKLAAAS